MRQDFPRYAENCALRDFTKQDAEPLADIEYDHEVKKYLDLPDQPRFDWIESFSPVDMRGWAIEALPECILAGRASISRPKTPAPAGIAELQIVIAQLFWGRKLGRQVAAILVPFAFDERNAIAVVAEVHPQNQASLSLLEAFAFVRCGVSEDGKRLIFKLDRQTYNSSWNGRAASATPNRPAVPSQCR